MNRAAKNTAPPGKDRVMAIDYGRKRMGVAISDELGMTARPLVTLERKNRRDDLRRLRELARAHQVGRIVVGNPVRLDGSAGEMAAEAAGFAARIAKELQLPVEMVDERLSSWEAQQTATTKTKRSKQSAGVDAVAAAVILREFLDHEQTRKPTRK